MSLKKVALPTISITLPVSKRELTIRGYTAAEERVLLMTNQEDATAISNAMHIMIHACCESSITQEELRNLPVMDTLYAFAQINIMSVGSTKQFTIKCASCKHEFSHTANMNNLVVPDSVIEPKVILNEKNELTLRSPTFEEMIVMDGAKGSGTDKGAAFDAGIRVLAQCVLSIVAEGEAHSAKDITVDEIVDWLIPLPKMMLEKVIAWMNALPAPYLPIAYICPKCGKSHEMKVSDIQSFFG